ncbi:hypothetical protein AAFC00_004549 [Neodothiora populina]|uniref:CUE domain-containing protein n=1 Tax=Neodothiora populina TaxID=2781224 RepID=A0ABR3P2Q2_9PEZI
MAEQTSINFGQIFAVAIVGYLVFRWFTASNSPSTPSSSRNGGRSRVSLAHVEQVAQMFPQLDRRTIMWDLQRNGGSVAATTERVLTGRPLDTPPPSFRPQIPEPATNTSSTGTTRQAKPANPDLITRYNLANKVTQQADAGEATTSGSSSKPPGWSANKNERAEALKRRREEMVLSARRKMEERDRANKAAAAST